MNRADEPVLQEAARQAWLERNQRWLAERFARWLARVEGIGVEAGAPAAGIEAAAGSNEDDFEPALLWLARSFGLSPFETEVLALAAGIELDPRLREAIARAQGLPSTAAVQLRFGFALAVVPQAHWEALSPLAPLRRWLLLRFDLADGAAHAQLRIDERVLHHIAGTLAFDTPLQGLARLDLTEPVAGAADAAEAPLVQQIAAALAGHHNAFVMLPNALQDAARKRTARSLAGAAWRQLGLRALWVDAAALPSDARELDEIARRLDREAALSGAGVALTVSPDDAEAASATRLLAAMGGPVLLLGALAPARLADLPQRHPLRFTLPTPQAALGADLPPQVRRCAARALQQFHVDDALLEQALAAVTRVEDPAEIEATLWASLRESARGGLDALAQRIDSRACFDDLVVPPFVAAQLRDIAEQLRHRQQVYDEWGFGARGARGLGIAALFCGESGTGKTLAAEAIANETGLDLYRVDLASTVSKYIGETEKNLGRLFDAAEASGAVLLFDEADALFGKRSEVKDSRDRYANIEVAYLLQRIESYRGLAVLTTNQKSALDRAFIRRIRFIVQFPLPDEAAREQIWRRQFPPRAPLGDVDFARLARVQLSGGHIRSVALNAAFRAAGRGEPIGHGTVVEAARAEFMKLDRNFNSADGGGA